MYQAYLWENNVDPKDRDRTRLGMMRLLSKKLQGSQEVACVWQLIFYFLCAKQLIEAQMNDAFLVGSVSRPFNASW